MTALYFDVGNGWEGHVFDRTGRLVYSAYGHKLEYVRDAIRADCSVAIQWAPGQQRWKIQTRL